MIWRFLIWSGIGSTPVRGEAVPSSLEISPERHRGAEAIRTLVGLVALILLTACGGKARRLHPGPATGWLESTGFQDRGIWRSSALHLERREIQRSDRISVLLRTAPGIRIEGRKRGEWGVYQIRPATGDVCAIHVYLNGDRVEPAVSEDPFTLDYFVPAALLDGLELHLGESGPTFEEDGCGSLLLWSEELRRPEDGPFRGSLAGRVRSEPPDTVIQARIEPGGAEEDLGRDGGFSFRELLPGEYELVFLSPHGPVTRRTLRVFAHRESVVELDVGRGKTVEPGGSREKEERRETRERG